MLSAILSVFHVRKLRIEVVKLRTPISNIMDELGGYYTLVQEVRQTNKCCVISLICGIQELKLVNLTEKKQIHRYREQTNGYQWGERREEGQDRAGGLRGTNCLQIKYISYKDAAKGI